MTSEALAARNDGAPGLLLSIGHTVEPRALRNPICVACKEAAQVCLLPTANATTTVPLALKVTKLSNKPAQQSPEACDLIVALQQPARPSSIDKCSLPYATLGRRPDSFSCTAETQRISPYDSSMHVSTSFR